MGRGARRGSLFPLRRLGQPSCSLTSTAAHHQETATMKMQSVLRDWKGQAAGHESVNLAFLGSLSRKTEKVVDRTARRLHREAFAIIDCTRCANCCKTMTPTYTQEEAETVADYLGMEDGDFVASYLERSKDRDRLKPRVRPCPFLGTDGRCTIYEVRPASCRDFPHTNRSGFALWGPFHSENAIHCPAVFYIIEQMRARGVR